jgi:uncharacterized membrane protein
MIAIGIKFVKKFATFVLWVVVGMIAALVVNVVLPAIGFPNPFEWMSEKIGIAGGFGINV